jgi:hypothetical protein
MGQRKDHPIFEKVSREIKQGSGVPFCPRMETLNGKPVIRKPKGQNERTGRNTGWPISAVLRWAFFRRSDEQERRD